MLTSDERARELMDEWRAYLIAHDPQTRRLVERIAALKAAARAVVDEMTGRTVPKGTQLWCDWCDSTPVGSDDPRMEERDYAQHYAACPVGVLAALVRPVEAGPWAASWARCGGCEHRWMAVFPVAATVLECPSCGVVAGIPDDQEDVV